MLSYIYDGVEYKAFNHLYAVSRCGRFLRKGKPVEPIMRKDGYLSVGRQQLAHRLVAAVWCHKPPDAHHVHHINHNKQDNRAENLMWISPVVHMRDHHPDSSRGHQMSEAGRAKLRSLRLGSKTSELTKQKQRDASIRLGSKPPPRPTGYKCAESAKQKMRENSPNALPCVIFNQQYPSVNIAAQQLGIKRLTLRKRILSPNFPEYQYANET